MNLCEGNLSDFQKKKTSGETETTELRNGVVFWRFVLHGVPDQVHSISILVVRGMIAVRWLKANAGTNEQEMSLPTPEYLETWSLSRNLGLF